MSTDLKVLLKCQFCLNEYNIPKILPCGNNICSQCIHQVISATRSNKPTIRCKYCDMEHAIGEDMMTNYSVLNLIQAINSNNRAHLKNTSYTRQQASTNRAKLVNNNTSMPVLPTIREVSSKTSSPLPPASAPIMMPPSDWHEISRLILPADAGDNPEMNSLVNHIKLINNSYSQLRVDMNWIFHDGFHSKNNVTKSIASISSEFKLVYLYERVYGRVKTCYLTVIKLSEHSNRLFKFNSTEISDQFCHFQSMKCDEKFIVLVFRCWQDQFHIKVLDSASLAIKAEQRIFGIEIEDLMLDKDRIYLITRDADSKKCLSFNSLVKEYDTTLLKKMRSFGQNRKESKPFFLGDEIIDIRSEKIFVKYQNTIRALSTLNGSFLYKFELDRVSLAIVVVLKREDVEIGSSKEATQAELTDDMFQIYNGFDKISLVNNTGKSIVENKLRLDDWAVGDRFDDLFYFKTTKRFGFVNSEKNYVLID